MKFNTYRNLPLLHRVDKQLIADFDVQRNKHLCGFESESDVAREDLRRALILLATLSHVGSSFAAGAHFQKGEGGVGMDAILPLGTSGQLDLAMINCRRVGPAIKFSWIYTFAGTNRYQNLNKSQIRSKQRSNYRSA
ncbi:hypothetical protein AB8A28_15550 [Tardiphaga sp. 71_E8_N1_1]|uniref:hypothetical protein n=1 Tax=Tardiphaga sp. 71_E8_N1_1 TaxID=3240784 RepID=UPI003F8C8633